MIIIVTCVIFAAMLYTLVRRWGALFVVRGLRCSKCGYELAGVPGPVCPECGDSRRFESAQHGRIVPHAAAIFVAATCALYPLFTGLSFMHSLSFMNNMFTAQPVFSVPRGSNEQPFYAANLLITMATAMLSARAATSYLCRPKHRANATKASLHVVLPLCVPAIPVLTAFHRGDYLWPCSFQCWTLPVWAAVALTSLGARRELFGNTQFFHEKWLGISVRGAMGKRLNNSVPQQSS